MTNPLIQKREINPALIAALDHYAAHRYDPNMPHYFCHTDASGHQSDWSIERTAAMAHEILVSYELHFLELKQLKEGLEKMGMAHFYERITGRPLT